MTLAVGGLSAPSGEIEAKQAEAQRVLEQIRAIDSSLDKVVDAYNGANERLKTIESNLRVGRRHVALARRSLKRSQRTLAERLVALYTSENQSALEVILGAASLDELLDRVDTVKRVSDQDARIVEEVRSARIETRRRERQLARALAEQKQTVAELSAHRDSIEAQLVERQRLFDSIKDEIAVLEAEERERQRRLAAEAQAQLEAEQAASSAPPQPAPLGVISSSEVVGPAPPPRYSGVVGIAMQYRGIPYQWGGSSPATGFDCSGFVMYVYSQMGVSLPHHAASQFGYGAPVSREQLQAGDLVFFDGLGHNGIYIGGGLFIHSPHTGDVVKISSLDDSWYSATWVGARRL